MQRVLILLLCIFVTGSCSDIKIETVNPSHVIKPETLSEKDFVTDVSSPHIFEAKNHGYHTFRIPAIVKTKEGTLIAFCEGRKNSGSDTGDINLICRRSIDGGKSWSRIIMIWDDGENTCGNPSPVVDPITGRIHLLMTWNNGLDGKSASDFNKEGLTIDTRRVFYTFSDDDGKSWNTPKEITLSAKKDNWGWYATGPCHAIILQHGLYKGRIVIPCDHNVIGGKGYSHVIYSDDNGKTWKIGGEVLGGNECSIEELHNGNIIMSCRSSGYRIIAYSQDGGNTFSTGNKCISLPDPTCQGSMIGVDFDGRQILLHANCAATSRIMLTVKSSQDDGKTWSLGKTIWEGKSAYSDIVVLEDGTLGILYENGLKSSYERISFSALKIKDCL